MSQTHSQSLPTSHPLVCTGGGSGEGGRQKRKPENKVASVIAKREFGTVPCKADKLKLSP